MKLISHIDFGKLRLENFVKSRKQIDEIHGWEFMDDLWIGEKFGFTEFLRLETEPTIVRSISIDFNYLKAKKIKELINSLALPLNKGMKKDEIIDIFGEPLNIENFSNDRLTYEYLIGENEKYYISCTIHNKKGLIYLVIMNHDKTINELQ